MNLLGVLGQGNKQGSRVRPVALTERVSAAVLRFASMHGAVLRTGAAIAASAFFLALSLQTRQLPALDIYIVLLPAVVMSALLAGRLGGFVSTVIVVAGTAWYHMPPLNSFTVEDPIDVLRLESLAVAGGLIAWLCGALQESRARLAATLLSVGDAVIMTDRRGRISLMNRLAESLTGWPRNEAAGRPLRDVFQILREDTGERLEAPIQMVLGELRVSEPHDGICLISRSGSAIPVEDSAAMVQAGSGRIAGAVLVFRDVRKRKQREAALRQAELHRSQSQRMETVGQLAGGVAHSFNNLLTVISGYSSMLLGQMSPRDPWHDEIREIYRAGESAAGIAHRLLVFSRGIVAKRELVDLNRVVGNAVCFLRQLIGDDIRVTVNLAGEELLTIADAGAIEQIMMNLAANARDAMPHGGTLTIETSRTAGVDGKPASWVALSVADNGIGMDEETRERIFDPFFTTKGVGKGTGLGLSMVYGIAQQSNGHLTVETKPGQGATFRFCLPSAESVCEEPPARRPSPPTQRGAGTILLVDDNAEVRRLIGEILTSLGYMVIEAGDPECAEKAALGHAGPIDLLLTSMEMPGLSGFDLFRRMAATRPKMAVLCVSGDTSEQLARKVVQTIAVGSALRPGGIDLI